MSQQQPTSLWGRFRRLVGGEERTEEGGAGVEASPAEGRQREEPGEEREQGAGEKKPTGKEEPLAESFSALELRDRVVVMLLFDQVVHIEQVAAAWEYWRGDELDTPDTLWRVVALMPGVNRDAVYAAAARVYAFKPVDFNMYGARALLRKNQRVFAPNQLRRMVDLNVAPVRTEYEAEKDITRWIFASHDPARPSVKHLLSSLDVASHALCYAPQEPIEQVFDSALPKLAGKRETLKLLPEPSRGAEAREKEHRFLENFGGSAFATAVHPDAGADGVRGPGAGTMDEQLAPGKLFDEVLKGVIQSGGQAAYLFGNAQGQLEIFHRFRRRLRHWRTETRVPAGVMIDFVSGRLLSLRVAQADSEESVGYWIENREVDLRPAIKPAGTLSASLPVPEDEEVVIIEVLR